MWVSTKHSTEWVEERATKRDENGRTITTAMFSVQPELSVCGVYLFLPILLAIVVLSLSEGAEKRSWRQI